MANNIKTNRFMMVGAGASYGQHKKYYPPLGKDLAFNLRVAIPSFIKIEQRLNKMCGEDFEAWLSSFLDRPEEFTHILWCVSKYFSMFSNLPEDSLYLKFIKNINEEIILHTTFSSLNYESLLELALRKHGYYLNWGAIPYQDNFNDHELRDKTIPFFKPHGSSHFMAENWQVGAVVSDSSSRIIGNTYIEDPKKMKNNNNRLSVISAYEPNKSTPLNTDFIDTIRTNLFKVVESSKIALIIGVSYRPDDIFIQKLIRTLFMNKVPIGYVGTEDERDKYFKAYRDFEPNIYYLGLFEDSTINETIKFLEQDIVL
ncbi:MAG: hypothetical protein WD355_07705 [Balneolaceae bacterium]